MGVLVIRPGGMGVFVSPGGVFFVGTGSDVGVSVSVGVAVGDDVGVWVSVAVGV